MERFWSVTALNKDKSGCIDFEDYTEVMLRVQKYLAGAEEFDAETVRTSLAQRWSFEADIGQQRGNDAGSLLMSYEAFQSVCMQLCEA